MPSSNRPFGLTFFINLKIKKPWPFEKIEEIVSPRYSGNDFFKIKVENKVLSPFQPTKNVQNQIQMHLGF